MATSSTTQSALLSGAAKDDVVGLNGDYIFTVKDLLANDPGGAAKVDLTTQFFFGDAGSTTQFADQAAYMAAHGITKISDLDGGTYQINAGATDFNYFVQIGNKGTWSEAHVDVAGAPAPVGHLGSALFTENFDGNDNGGYGVLDSLPGQFAVVNFGLTESGAPNENGWVGGSHAELGADGYGTIESTSGGFWFDTMNSPGPANISHAFTDATAAVAGTTSVLSFDIGTQDLTYQGQHYATDPNASFEFKIDGQTVAQFDASDFSSPNGLVHFDIDISAYAGAGNQHTLELVDTTSVAGFTGFAIDSIQIHDWVV